MPLHLKHGVQECPQQRDAKQEQGECSSTDNLIVTSPHNAMVLTMLLITTRMNLTEGLESRVTTSHLARSSSCAQFNNRPGWFIGRKPPRTSRGRAHPGSEGAGHPGSPRRLALGQKDAGGRGWWEPVPCSISGIISEALCLVKHKPEPEGRTRRFGKVVCPRLGRGTGVVWGGARIRAGTTGSST